jgi:hypothetical protein
VHRHAEHGGSRERRNGERVGQRWAWIDPGQFANEQLHV